MLVKYTSMPFMFGNICAKFASSCARLHVHEHVLAGHSSKSMLGGVDLFACILIEGVCFENSGHPHPPARVDRRCRAAVRGPHPEDPADLVDLWGPRMGSLSIFSLKQHFGLRTAGPGSQTQGLRPRIPDPGPETPGPGPWACGPGSRSLGSCIPQM